ncbi:MAG: hypothetical protein WBK76_05605 [Candidatus Saccharimonadales bacterium]
MSPSETSFVLRAEQIAQTVATRRQLEDAEQLRNTIVGTEDGHWLLNTLQSVRRKGSTARLGTARRFQFLGKSAEDVINGRSDESCHQIIDMPAQSVVRKIEGSGYGTWLFEVENNKFGDDHEQIVVAFRKVGHDYLLYLKRHRRGENQATGRRAGTRFRGAGPDRSF